MSDFVEPIRLVAETPDTVTLRRADYEALLAELDELEDRMSVLEHRLAKATGKVPELLTVEEADRLIAGENPVRFWREKRGLTARALATAAEVSPSLLSKTGSIETLNKLAHALKVDLDTLAS